MAKRVIEIYQRGIRGQCLPETLRNSIREKAD